MDRQKKLHMIGNAHLDPVWMWRWQEGFQEAKATFRSALDRMSESEDFIFTQSSAAYYEWVERSDPAMFEEIRRRVQEGRWQPVGGWWVEPDCNIPSGESMVRQGLYGQRYFNEKFGVTTKVGYNVDSFGHSNTIPQILKKSGINYYVFMRPMPGEKALPGTLFYWEADDGSKVLTFRILFEYLTWGKEVDIHVRRCAAEVKPPMNSAMVFYGVGNHGGGPTRENIDSIRQLNAGQEEMNLIFSHPQRFFEEITGEDMKFPDMQGDLQHHASGCYAAHSGIKAWNRRTENGLMAAEKFSSAALAVAGQPYPDFGSAWKNLLFNQFHDILAGASIEKAYEDVQIQLYESRSIAERALNYASQALSWRIGIPQEDNMLPLVIFNPNAWETRSCVEAELTESAVKDGCLLDEEGNRHPLQPTQPEASSNGRSRFCFMADLPAFGYKVYRLVAGIGEKAEGPLANGDIYEAENDWYRLVLDRETGYIGSLYDKQNEVDVFTGSAAVPVVMRDESDTWSHDVLRFEDRIGAFTANKVYCAEQGPVRTVLRVESVWGNSRMIQDFILHHNKKQIDVRVTVDWHEKHQLLKLLFPINVNFPQGTYDSPYGCIMREGNGEEEPMQNWVDVSGLVPGSGKGYMAGAAILNDCKYSASITKNEMGITLLRSPIYANHLPYLPKDGVSYRYMDQGEQRFRYSILPHVGSWTDHVIPKAAWEINQPPVVVVESYHEGSLPQQMSFASVDCDHVLLTVVKRSEDGKGYVFRAYECCKMEAEATILIPFMNTRIKAHFKPGEIKTFRIDDGWLEAAEILMTELPER